MDAMIYVYIVLLLVINAFWLALAIFYVPGNWLMLLTTLGFAWWQSERNLFSPWTLTAAALLALAGELVEFFAGFGGAKKAGAGWKASLSAVAGALAGAVIGTFLIPLPLIGTLLGACVGAGLSTWGVERIYGRAEQSLRSGLFAGVGVLAGTAFKILMGLLIWAILAIAVFCP